MDREPQDRIAESHWHAEEWARFLKVVANPWRLRLLAELLREPLHVSELVERLELSQAYVSQQLARLRAAGLVEGDRSGRLVRYSISDARVPLVLESLERSRTASRIGRMDKR